MIQSASISTPVVIWRKNHLRGVAPKLVISNLVNLPRFKARDMIITMSASSNSRIKNETGLPRDLKHGASETDGVIVVDHGSRRQESNLMLNEFVSMFKAQTGYGIVEPAHMELAEPSIRDAFKSCVEKGAKRVIVSPFFLFPGRHWQQDIPALVAEASRDHPGISYIITAPLGLHELMVDVMKDRIEHCLSHVAGDADECSVCAGTGKCRLYQF